MSAPVSPNARRRTLGLALIVAGLVFLVAGWLRLRNAGILADQISFLASSGIGGPAMVMSGLALVASANSRDEAAGRLARIEAEARLGGSGVGPPRRRDEPPGEEPISTVIRREAGEDVP